MTYRPSDDWQYDVPTSGSKRLPPAPRSVESLSHQGYSFEAAIADLIDNSIDAGATKVVISFLRDGDRLVSLLIIDDGRGMDEAGLDVAMTVGGQSEYAPDALGHFGAGLKAASLSHADSFSVISRTKRSPSAGRRLLTSAAQTDFTCDIVDARYCQDLVDRYDGVIEWHGTIVRWDGVRAFQTVTTGQTDRFLMEALHKLETHIGLHFHRFLSRDDFHIDVVVEDVHTREELSHDGIEPIDPFGYRVPGRKGYPRVFTAPIEKVGDLPMTAHIWPPKSGLVSFKGIGPVAERQGFYIYRNDRLVQAGGWNNTRAPETHHSLARVAVDLPSFDNDVFSLTVKKDGVEVTPAFARGLEKAADAEGTTFGTFLKEAEATYRDAARRTSEVKRPEVIPPGKGLDPKLKRTLKDELPQDDTEQSIAFRWESLPADQLFSIDRAEHVVRLNKKYRQAFSGDRRGGSNDAPVLKATLYMLLEKNFRMGRSSAQRDDEMALWNSVLLSAAHCEIARYESGADGQD
ncbi:ATP-binding protein [Streptomyces sp. NPDC047130]|uniref:ATP-binding protein n=1 Tax=Streptomyces sp. NPDC047130 TaxID=3155261 RepID=UPI00340650A3